MVELCLSYQNIGYLDTLPFHVDIYMNMHIGLICSMFNLVLTTVTKSDFNGIGINKKMS